MRTTYACKRKGIPRIYPWGGCQLSFAGDTFHGGVVVKARGIAHALLIANQLKINPGGEVFCVEIPEDKTPDSRFLNRLLTKPEIEQMWGEPCKSIREWEEEEEAAS